MNDSSIEQLGKFLSSIPDSTKQELASKFLPMFTGTVTPMRKPEYTDNIPPSYVDKIQICRRNESDRFYTEIKVWLKPPSFRFPNIGSFISFSNGKTNVFSTMTVNDLKTLKSWLEVQIPIIEAKTDELKPLVASQELAKRAYDSVLNNNEEE